MFETFEFPAIDCCYRSRDASNYHNSRESSRLIDQAEISRRARARDLHTARVALIVTRRKLMKRIQQPGYIRAIVYVTSLLGFSLHLPVSV